MLFNTLVFQEPPTVIELNSPNSSLAGFPDLFRQSCGGIWVSSGAQDVPQSRASCASCFRVPLCFRCNGTSAGLRQCASLYSITPQPSKKAAQLSAAQVALDAVRDSPAMLENLARDAATASRTPTQTAAMSVQEGIGRSDPELRSLIAHWLAAEGGGRPLPAPYLLLADVCHKGAVRMFQRREGGGDGAAAAGAAGAATGVPDICTASGAPAANQCAAGALVRALVDEGANYGVRRLENPNHGSAGTQNWFRSPLAPSFLQPGAPCRRAFCGRPLGGASRPRQPSARRCQLRSAAAGDSARGRSAA